MGVFGNQWVQDNCETVINFVFALSRNLISLLNHVLSPTLSLLSSLFMHKSFWSDDNGNNMTRTKSFGALDSSFHLFVLRINKADRKSENTFELSHIEWKMLRSS